MIFKYALLLWLLNYSSALDANCDYYQEVIPGQTYYVYSPNYPRNYSGGTTCRWIAACPTGYNCRLVCPEINIPQSQSCSLDRLLVSRSGDPQLSGADTYCGRGSLTAVSIGQIISIGLSSSYGSPGGTISCQLTAQAAGTNTTCSCGLRRQNRIVGGQETGVNEYTMMVGLVDMNVRQIKCGGVIISSKHVLTAAHCVYKKTVADFAVVVGEHDVNTGDSPSTAPYRIAQYIIHPLFSNSDNLDYDIAIVVTTSEIQFDDRVLPACLPFKFKNTNFTGSKVTILGWGTLFPGGPTSNVLRKVDLDVISQSSCKSQVPSLTDRQMCTFTPGKDSCQDDSGGPLLYTDPATGRLFSIGIVSYGRFCASNTPGVNTRVPVLLDWIVSNTQSYNFCRY